LRRRDARLRRDADLVEPADLVEDALRRREREDGDGGAAERGDAPELDDAGDPVALRRLARRHADDVADAEVLLARRVLVDRDLVGAARPAPGDERQRVEARDR